MGTEQDLEKQFFDLNDEVRGAVAEDAEDKDRRSPKLRPMLGADQCLGIRCEVKENNRKLEDRVAKLKKESGAQFREIERLKGALKEGVSVEERKDALTKAAVDGYVQTFKHEADDLRAQIVERDARVAELLRSVDGLKTELDDYAGLIRTDAKLAEKFKEYRLRQEQCAKLDAWYKDAEQEAQQFFVESEKARNEVVALQRMRDETRAEYENAKKLLRHADELARNGFRVEAPKKPFFRNPFKK